MGHRFAPVFKYDASRTKFTFDPLYSLKYAFFEASKMASKSKTVRDMDLKFKLGLEKPKRGSQIRGFGLKVLR